MALNSLGPGRGPGSRPQGRLRVRVPGPKWGKAKSKITIKWFNSRGTSTVDVDIENMTMPNRGLRTLTLRFSVDVES